MILRVSVIVPTYRRAVDLKRCLAALRAQTRVPDEVLVIARPEDDATAQRMTVELKGAHRFALRVIDTGAGGQVTALNRGLDAASGDIVAITDDDAAPRADWIERIAAAFESDERLGAIGGRDWVFEKGRVLNGARDEVGVIRRNGRVIGNHHLGVGPAREVRMLKGANMSYRRMAVGALRFDTRLRGTGAQVHNDMAFSMSVRRAGWRVMYDPRIAVDHFPAERFDDDRRDAQTLGALTDAAYNFHLILGEQLESPDREIAWFWHALIGTRVYPGVAHAFAALPKGLSRAWQRWRAVRKGASQARQRRRSADASRSEDPMTHVHVHLFYGADPRTYRVGDNIGCLYGYHHAESPEFDLSYSRDAAEGKPMRFLRRAMKQVIGFDFIHTWRNREAILASDVVWTHTEQEHLSVALLYMLRRRDQKAPLLLAQSIWLIDKWKSYGALRRWLYRKLIAREDILTTHSSVNAALVREYFGRDAQQVFYGLNTQDFALKVPVVWTPHAPVRIGAIGNDRDRDWTTLAEAFRNDERYDVRIATRRRVPAHLRADNVHVGPAIGLKAARELYDWADVIVVPLRENTHASGLTVLLEAVALGKPVIVTDVGGLRDYFGTGHVAYVPPHDAEALRAALNEMLADPTMALMRAQVALRHFVARDYTTREFALQHVRLTRDALEHGHGNASGAKRPARHAFARDPEPSRRHRTS